MREYDVYGIVKIKAVAKFIHLNINWCEEKEERKTNCPHDRLGKSEIQSKWYVFLRFHLHKKRRLFTIFYISL
jgi:hypothetical protein